MPILVTYGSKRGGTVGIAAQLGEVLRQRGFAVEVRAAPDVSDADVPSYDAVVVGGALYMNLWHRYARGFVRRNAAALRRRPVWLFSSGPLDGSAVANDIPPTRGVQRLMDLVGALGHVTFGGRLTPDARGFPASAMARKHSGDWRDPAQVRAWAEGIAQSLTRRRPVESSSRGVPTADAHRFASVSRAALVVSLGALSCAAVASVATLAWAGAFPSPSLAPPVNRLLAEARGWSLVTLLFLVPLAAAALRAAQLGSVRGRLVWAGCMAYLVYTYLEFAVSGPFTALFLVHVLTLALSVTSLVIAVGTAEVASLPRWFSGRTPRRLTAAVALLFVSGLGAVWLKGIAVRLAVGDVGWPDAYGSVEQVVHALDLGLLVPLGVAAGTLLLQRRPSGYLVGAIWLVVAFEMGTALTAMAIASAPTAAQSLVTAAPFATLPIVAAALAIPYFRSIRPPAGDIVRGGSERPEIPEPSDSQSWNPPDEQIQSGARGDSGLMPG